MRTILLLLVTTLTSFGAINTNFVRAIHLVETGGRVGLIWGNHRELGPLQITEKYWRDSRVQGSYLMVTNLDYSVKVMEAYMRRYCPKALKRNDFETMARTHNGGMRYNRQLTNAYWRKVKSCLTSLKE